MPEKARCGGGGGTLDALAAAAEGSGAEFTCAAATVGGVTVSAG